MEAVCLPKNRSGHDNPLLQNDVFLLGKNCEDNTCQFGCKTSKLPFLRSAQVAAKFRFSFVLFCQQKNNFDRNDVLWAQVRPNSWKAVSFGSEMQMRMEMKIGNLLFCFSMTNFVILMNFVFLLKLHACQEAHHTSSHLHEECAKDSN